MFRMPKSVRLTRLLMVLALLIKAPKWFVGTYDVREPVDWVFIAVAAAAAAAALWAAASCWVKARRSNAHLPQESSEKSSFHRTLSVGMAICALVAFGAILNTLGSTDESVSTARVFGWAGFSAMAVAMLALMGTAVWASARKSRQR